MQSLTKLVTLFAESNQIKQIPGWIGKFSSLKTLNLESNLLQNLPKEMLELRKMETLRLAKNPLPGNIARSVLNDHTQSQVKKITAFSPFFFFFLVCAKGASRRHRFAQLHYSSAKG